MERLLEKHKYLGIILSNYLSLEDCQHCPQRLFGKTNSNINITRLFSTYSKGNNETFYKAKTRRPSNKYYKVH